MPVTDKTVAQRRKERRDGLFRKHFHSEKRVLFIQDQPCELTGLCYAHFIHCAHTKTRGSGGTYKDTVPLTHEAHRDFDLMSDNAFEAKYPGRTKQSVRDRAPFYQQLWEESRE